jgi:hypothetical protein
VKAAVGGILVLAPTRGAEREPGHRRVRPVVRDGAHDREPRAALGAVDERVAVTAVGRVEELAQALVAGRDVGGDQGAAAGGGARLDRELGLAAGGARFRSDRLDAGERRGVAAQRGREGVERGRLPFRLDDDARAVVQHEAAEPVRAGEPVDEGTEAHSLDDPQDPEVAPLDGHAVDCFCQSRPGKR